MRGYGTAIASVFLVVFAVVAAPDRASASDCSRTSTGLVPLADLGTGSYLGEEGGLYPGGSNERPAAHEQAGQGLGDGVVALDSAGKADPTGQYALISIGMSNTTQEFQPFVSLANADPGKDPALRVVDGAQSSVTASRWVNPADPAWSTLDSRLAAAGVSPNQVRVAWVKLADAGPSSTWPTYARQLQSEEEQILQLLRDRFPKLALTYLSSRIYAGYASTGLNPEPYAYEGGFSVKWVIEDQLGGVSTLNWDRKAGPVEAPWLSWGPYLWADGLTPRGSDGLTWACSDLSSDGTHPSPSGAAKVASLLLDFFQHDSTARLWFNATNSTERELGLRITRRSVAKGKLEASVGFAGCVQKAKVRLERRDSGSWHRAGIDRTNGDGDFAIKLEHDGTYRARVSRGDAGVEGDETCLAARSRSRRAG